MADQNPFKVAPEEKKASPPVIPLEERKKAAAVKFQKIWRGFYSRKLHHAITIKLAAKRANKPNIPQTADAAKRTVKSILKPEEKAGDNNNKTQTLKRVRFQDMPPLKPSPEPKGKMSSTNVVKKPKKVLFPRAQSEEESKNDIQKRLEKTLTKVEDFLKKEGVKIQSPAKVSPKRETIKIGSSLSQLDKIDITRFIQKSLINQIVNNAFLYGESLLLSRQIQQKFENRPVPKDVFALFHEFQYPIQDPLPHSLHCISSLGRVLYQEAMGHLHQIDIMTGSQLSPYFLGIRMPLRYTPILDTICDVKSCRIYTLNALWKLEVWSLEQPSSLPIKRVPMVNCEVTKDFVETSYKQRYMLSKPTFLSMTDASNQILIVNTSCVDGNIAFVDPISLSILKRIHFIFNDYEIPADLKDSIERLIACLIAALGKPESAITLLKSLPTTAPLTYSEFAEKLCSQAPQIDKVSRIFSILSTHQKYPKY